MTIMVIVFYQPNKKKQILLLHLNRLKHTSVSICYFANNKKCSNKCLWL